MQQLKQNQNTLQHQQQQQQQRDQNQRHGSTSKVWTRVCSLTTARSIHNNQKLMSTQIEL
jgi:hypothetical protein